MGGRLQSSCGAHGFRNTYGWRTYTVEHCTSIAAIAFIFPYLTISGRWTLGIDSNTENGVIAGERETNGSDPVNAWWIIIINTMWHCRAKYKVHNPQSSEWSPLSTDYFVRPLFSLLVECAKRQPKRGHYIKQLGWCNCYDKSTLRWTQIMTHCVSICNAIWHKTSLFLSEDQRYHCRLFGITFNQIANQNEPSNFAWKIIRPKSTSVDSRTNISWVMIIINDVRDTDDWWHSRLFE